MAPIALRVAPIARIRAVAPIARAIGAAEPQEGPQYAAKASRACGTPIAELSGPPTALLVLAMSVVAALCLSRTPAFSEERAHRGRVAPPSPVNLALHLPLLGTGEPTRPGYVFEHGMTWNEYTGAGLTDGIWWDHGANFFQDGEAVWIYPPAQNAVTFDLGSDQPLGEVRVHSLFRPGNCSPPENIVVLVSANNVRYFYTAEMPRRDAVFTKSLHFNAKADSAAAAVSNYFTVAYDANRLNTHGRYVKFVLMASPTDSVRMWIEEIEIFRGDPAFSGTPLGGAGIVGNGPQLSAGIGWQRRLALDSSLLAARAARAGLDLASPLQSISNRRRAFTDHYRELAHLKTYFPLDPIDPGGHESLGKIQRDLIRLNAAILRKQGCTGLVAWRSNSPWDPLDAYSEPASGRPPRSIDLAMMNGERRAAAVNLSNAADSEATVSLNIDGFAAATRNPDWIERLRRPRHGHPAERPSVRPVRRPCCGARPVTPCTFPPA